MKYENLTDKQQLYFETMKQMTKGELERFITAMENDDVTALENSISQKRWEVVRAAVLEKRK